MATTRMTFMRTFTTQVVNPVTRRFAGRLPGFGIVTYTGRTSGRTYHTPINVFRRGDEYLFALTYGSDVQWVKNVQAAGHCRLQQHGSVIELDEPTMIPASENPLKMSKLQPSGHILTNLLPNGRLLALFPGQENPVGLAHMLLPTKAQLIKL